MVVTAAGMAAMVAGTAMLSGMVAVTGTDRHGAASSYGSA
jgi:hypothetical protein